MYWGPPTPSPTKGGDRRGHRVFAVNLVLTLGITVALEAALLGTATAVALLALPRLLLLRSARR